jgi:type IV pilus assembly protein PilC
VPEFIARIGTSDGTVMERAFTADSEKALLDDLKGREYLVFGIRRKSALAGLIPGGGRSRSVSMKEFLLFNQELAALIKAGLPILAGLDILIERRKNPVFRKALTDVRDRVRGGAALSEAFDAQGDLFPKIYSSTVASGERSGEVASVLQRYISYQKTMMTLRRKIVSALIYPSFLFLVSVGIVIIFITYVVPKFKEFYADFGADLPLITKLLVGLSAGVTEHAPIVLVLLLGAVVGARMWLKTPQGRLALDRWKVRLPLVGAIWHRFAVSRFARTLGTLVAGGIPVVTAIGISAHAVGNQEFERELLTVERKVREGGSLWQSLEETGLFSDIAIEMTKVGESTGSLQEMLTHVASFYDEEIDNRLQTLIALLEPAMLIGMGFLIGVMFLAIYLPLLRSYAQSSF